MALRFSFALQTLLNWKKSLEELSQLRLAEKTKRLRIKEEEILRLTRERSFYEEDLRGKIREGIKAGEFLIYKGYADTSYQVLLSKGEEKGRIIEEVEGERRNLLTLSKEKKIVEKLREKRLKRFLYEIETSEEKKNDEMVVLRYEPPSKGIKG
jgi:flagellar FliJ protein